MNTHEPLWIRKYSSLQVWGLPGGIAISSPQGTVLFGTPEGTSRIVAPALPEIAALVFGTGRASAVAGLSSLLALMEVARQEPVLLWAPLGENRPALVLEAWAQAYELGFSVIIEAEAPGGWFDMAGLSIRTFAIQQTELKKNRSQPMNGAGFDIRAADVRIVWAPGMSQIDTLLRYVPGADLAVVEILPGGPLVQEGMKLLGYPQELLLLEADGTPIDIAEA